MDKRIELERLITKMNLKERTGLEISDEEILTMLTLFCDLPDKSTLQMTKEQLEETDRLDYAKAFSRVVPRVRDADNIWDFMEYCMLPDLKGIIDKIKYVVGTGTLTTLEKKACYKQQEKKLAAWIALFDNLCLKIINAAEICHDEGAELDVDFLITGNVDELEKHVVAWTNAVHLIDENGAFDLDNYYSIGFLDFYQYFYDLVSFAVKRKSEDEIFYFHISWLILLLAFHTDFLLNHRL